VIDVDTLSTLPPRELNSGFAEVIKHGMIADKDYFELVRKLTPAKVTATQYVDLIEGSCRIKSRVVEQDEKEAGLRKILNFGHTVGHALEALSHEGGEILLHGEAVALGMVAEAHISKEVGLIDSKVVSELEDVLERFALPTRLKDMVPVEKLYQLMSTDKKNLAGSIKWTLLEDLGKATFDCDVPRKVVERALAALYQEEQ
jgi:3-dehydroquinate synthase